jgi:hypothetical protein
MKRFVKKSIIDDIERNLAFASYLHNHEPQG